MVRSRLVTLTVVVAGWVVFRADSLGAAGEYLMRIARWESAGTRLLSPYILPACVAVLAAHLAQPQGQQLESRGPSAAGARAARCYASIMFSDRELRRHRRRAFHLLPVLRWPRSDKWYRE